MGMGDTSILKFNSVKKIGNITEAWLGCCIKVFFACSDDALVFLTEDRTRKA
ncbi:4266_t:CDS:2, partial [Gigaspora margarita]